MGDWLVLNGSPRGRSGNTAVLVDRFIAGIKSASKQELELGYIELNRKKIEGCTGCFSCWSDTPGECIHEDDMENLLNLYIEADHLIWATPLYHHGMSSLMKRFLERTLPLNEPEITKLGENYTHPQRYDYRDKQHLLFSTCGFPERSNFDLLVEHFHRIAGDNLQETVLAVMGELLTKQPLQNRISWYLDALQRAGKEYAREGSFSEETRRTLAKKLVPTEDYIEMANASWKKDLEEDEGEGEQGKGHNLMKLMSHAFDSEAADDLEAVLEFEFTDLDETNHFVIENGQCRLRRGASENFTTKIVTPYETWKKISEGELDGAEALMEGEYRVEGDLDLMKRMDELFAVQQEEGNGSANRDEGIGNENDSILVSRRAMTFSFVPWILSWVFVETNWIVGLLVPLVYSLGLVGLKNIRGLEISYFEKANLIYFSVLNIVGLFDGGLLREAGIQLNYFAIAAIWFSSILFGKALSVDYSRHNYSPEIVQTQLFTKINRIITFVWSVIFVVMGASTILLKNYELAQWSPLLYVLIAAGLVFTNYFPEKYQQYRFS